MKDNFALIKNDKFCICFNITNQTFYHLYRLLTTYGDEIDINICDLVNAVVNKEANNEQD